MLPQKKFKRKKEDFVCENCGFFVKGDGYTNHCPKCLWSKHVDNNPGDRQSKCLGMMEPVDVFIKSGDYVILHKCVQCGIEKKNKVSQNDDFDAVLNLVTKKPF